ncbi:MgtC/SapB family protein [bacterium]|nr:MgtC/SapB family protein [bacterium]
MDTIFLFFEFVGESTAPLITRDSKLVFLAAIIGSLVGLEREIAGKDPSLRTFSLICMGSCLFAIISRESVAGMDFADPSRISAQIVTGIGFLGAGAIFRGKGKVSGLTTAALMWMTAAMGVAIGYGLVNLAVASSIIVFFVILSLKAVHFTLWYFRPNSFSEEGEFD